MVVMSRSRVGAHLRCRARRSRAGTAPHACHLSVTAQSAAGGCWPENRCSPQEMERELYEEVYRRQAEELYAAELAQLEEWQVGLYL